MTGICNRLINLQSLKSPISFQIFDFICKPTSRDPTLAVSAQLSGVHIRSRRPPTPKLKYPLWYLKKERANYTEHLTKQNEQFIKEVTHDKFGPPAVISGITTYQISSPLKNQPIAKGEWTPNSRRCGLVTRKIGCYPMWDKKGNIVWCTLLQVVDNHVVKYTPPEEVDNSKKTKLFLNPNKFGQVLVGAESCDPQLFTREYCGLFATAGLPPKRFLTKFTVTPNAALQPGTPLLASHFEPGDVVDVLGKTVYRGFQGVMKRWGFKGMPASHGVTKTHRRPGNIGGGGEKARVWPGTKMPGHMGNKWRTVRGLKIWRINTVYDVLYVQGLAVPGETNSIALVYDTLLPLRKKKEAPKYFPTFFREDVEALPDDMYDSELHPFDAPSIKFEDQK